MIFKGMENKLYEEYLTWLNRTHDISPDDTYMGLNEVESLKTIRDEFTGLLGETQIVKIMKEDGTFEENKTDWETKYSILTFEEYKKLYKS